MKHTPGPLEYEGGNIYDADGFGIADIHEMAVKKNWDSLGLRHWSEKPGIGYRELSEEEADANGLLFAAAPELLEALKDVYALALPLENHPAMKAAKAAIAKATT